VENELLGGVAGQGESVHGGSLGKRSSSGVKESCHWMCESGNVSSEEWGVSMEVSGGLLGLQEYEELIECRGLSFWCLER